MANFTVEKKMKNLMYGSVSHFLFVLHKIENHLQLPLLVLSSGKEDIYIFVENCVFLVEKCTFCVANFDSGEKNDKSNVLL